METRVETRVETRHRHRPARRASSRVRRARAHGAVVSSGRLDVVERVVVERVVAEGARVDDDGTLDAREGRWDEDEDSR